MALSHVLSDYGNQRMKLNHINIRANMELLDEVKQFYCDAFGLKEGYRPKVTRKGYWLYSDDAALIHLEESRDDLQAARHGHLEHVAFESTNVKSLIDRLNYMNVSYRSSYIEDLHLTQLFVFDPVGNKIEINFPGEKLE